MFDVNEEAPGRWRITLIETGLSWVSIGTRQEVDERLDRQSPGWTLKLAQRNGAKQVTPYRGVASTEARKKRCAAALKLEEKKQKKEQAARERESVRAHFATTAKQDDPKAEEASGAMTVQTEVVVETIKNLEDELGRTPKQREVAETLGVTTSVVAGKIDQARKKGLLPKPRPYVPASSEGALNRNGELPDSFAEKWVADRYGIRGRVRATSDGLRSELGRLPTPREVLQLLFQEDRVEDDDVDALTACLASEADTVVEQLQIALANVERAKAELRAVCKRISEAA